MDDPTRIELEAAMFRRLVAHVRQRTDVQTLDLMNLAGFCRVPPLAERRSASDRLPWRPRPWGRGRQGKRCGLRPFRGLLHLPLR
ncbi:MAG: hypothetical protein ACT4P2_14900 [Pseudomonadota bacterium]